MHAHPMLVPVHSVREDGLRDELGINEPTVLGSKLLSESSNKETAGSSTERPRCNNGCCASIGKVSQDSDPADALS
jgi:hypothetical protein